MRLLRSILQATVMGLILLLVLSLTAPVAHAQASSPPITVIVNTRILPAYGFLESGLTAVNVLVNSSSLLPLNQTLTFELTPSFPPSSVIGSATVGGNIVPLLVTPSGSVASYTYSFTLLQGTSHFDVTISGTESGTSVLWRYLTRLPSLGVRGLPVNNYTSYVTVPSGTILSQAYSSNGGTLALSSIAFPPKIGNGQTTYDVFIGAGLLVFQSTAFLPASIAITSIALAVIALAALNFFGSGRALLNQTVRRILPAGRKALKVFRIPGPRPGFRLRRLFLPRKLLVLFILCALVMVSAAAAGGPDPSVKAYAIAPQSSVSGIQSSLQAVTGGNVVVITPTADYTDFGVMSSVGQFNLVVVSDYPDPALSQASGFIIGNLGNVPVIVVDNLANVTFSAQIRALYGDKVFTVGNVANLTVGEQQEVRSLLAASARDNSFGFRVSPSEFTTLLELEAILSFVLIFLGWAFLGSLASESSSQSDLSHLVAVISSGVFVFVFSEAIYVVTSSLLAYPLSLHAVISGANVTAVGLLGFGGGSTPRLAAGFLGVVVGVVAVEGGPRIRGIDFALVAGIVLFLLANPLAIGQFVFQGLLLFVGNFAFGAAFSSSLSFKGFLYGVGAALGGGVTPQYLLSAGKILFFAGLAPLAYLKKMGRTTMVLMLLVAAVAIGDGGVRVGEMTPDKTVVAILPGIFVGFALVGLFLAIAIVEKYLRGNWKSRA